MTEAICWRTVKLRRKPEEEYRNTVTESGKKRDRYRQARSDHGNVGTRNIAFAVIVVVLLCAARTDRCLDLRTHFYHASEAI